MIYEDNLKTCVNARDLKKKRRKTLAGMQLAETPCTFYICILRMDEAITCGSGLDSTHLQSILVHVLQSPHIMLSCLISLNPDQRVLVLVTGQTSKRPEQQAPGITYIVQQIPSGKPQLPLVKYHISMIGSMIICNPLLSNLQIFCFSPDTHKK